MQTDDIIGGLVDLRERLRMTSKQSAFISFHLI